eukprot:c5800_g1_i1 orf=184-474(-)
MENFSHTTWQPHEEGGWPQIVKASQELNTHRSEESIHNDGGMRDRCLFIANVHNIGVWIWKSCRNKRRMICECGTKMRASPKVKTGFNRREVNLMF